MTGVQEGEVLAGKYRIEKILGSGGMGVVVAAYHIHLEDKVAIKFLLPDALAKEEVVSRFAREARAAVKIKSEHVARVLDVGTLETGAPYMVMEYLDGTDLSAWVQQRGALPIEQAVEFILHACEAIADAHSLGIIHRDLKPANLFCVRRSDGLLSIKVLDFGISKLTSLADSGADMSMTKTTSVLGSPLYMSPEQMLSSRDVDVRTDIWALGVILYELLVGKVPFSGDTLAELCVKIATVPAPPLRDRLPDAPLGLQEVIQKCMEKDRTKRYASIGELAVALAPFAPKRARASVERISRIMQAAGLSASALDLPPSSEARRPVPSETQAAWGQTKAPARWSAGKSAGVTLGLAAAAGLAGWAWTSRPTKNEYGANAVTSVADASTALAAANVSSATSPAAPLAPGSAVVLGASSNASVPHASPPSKAIPAPKPAPAQPTVTTRSAAVGAGPSRTAQSPQQTASSVTPVPPAQPGPEQCVPPCGAAQVCLRGQCVSACNPPCPPNEVCTPKGACVSACNPPCPAHEKCIAGGRCVAR